MNESNARTRPADNPVLVEVWRGEFLESRHRGALAVVDAGGDTVLQAGDVGSPVYSRSSLKPIQALDLLESGAAARFALDGGCICLACASHKGETEHTRRVGAWLEHIGLDASALECGAHRPYSDEARDDLVRRGRAPTALNNNCSGKHAGFLTTARHLGIDHHGYIHPDHEIQRRITRVIVETCDFAVDGQTPGVDGCGVPVWGIPLRKLARAFAAFAPAARGSGARAAARGSIVDAIVHNPYLIGGGGDFCSRVIGRGRGAVIVKTGAEGVFTGTLLGEGLGFALKIDDGASRASEVAMAALLEHFAVDADFRAALAGEVDVPMHNVAGRVVGRIVARSPAAL